jgi:hypothetical protein
MSSTGFFLSFVGRIPDIVPGKNAGWNVGKQDLISINASV